jgi:sarcosine oxidase delta subunit
VLVYLQLEGYVLTKQNSKNFLLKVLFSIAFTLICFLVFPIAAQAFDASNLYENKSYEKGDPLYYVNVQDDSYWVVSEGVWHKCFYDNASYDRLTSDVQQAMYDRESSYSTYFVVDKNEENSLTNIFNILGEQVYNDTELPCGGDYLQFMSTLELSGKSGKLTASSSSQSYDFYCIELVIDNMTTKQEEDMVSDYLDIINEYYIKNNSVIQNAAKDDREYYIVKTIYNFLAKNTVYDMDTYLNPESVDSERYRYSHTAYGALFGNTDGAYNPESFNYLASMKLDYSNDSQGLSRIVARNQGRSVCDGYSLVFYYLCKLNGIDCQIVEGDNVDGSNDPHAWNIVYLKDYDDPDYTWYYVDATFGCQKSKKITDIFSIIDYSYFLRGTENEYFSSENHQQMYSEFDSYSVSQTDYHFAIKNIDESQLYTVVTRRREADGNLEFVDTGEYNLEDYIIILPNGTLCKFNPNDENSLVVTNGFSFYGSGYWYSCAFVDYSKGTEYTCEDKFIRDVGDYLFNIVTIENEVAYKKTVTVAPLNMSDLSNYSTELTQYVGNINFIGENIPISVEIYDNSKTKLIEGKDYEVFCFIQGDSSKKAVSVNKPGNYTIEIDYKGNYSGYLQVPFVVNKADLSTLAAQQTQSVSIGTNISKSIPYLTLGDTTLQYGVDYNVDVVGTQNYGDSGKIIFTGLAGSAYVKEGTVATRDYIVDNKYDVSSLFNNQYISNAKYQYTGKAIQPTDFTLSYIDSRTGETVKLVLNEDYVIKSYSNNINIGTGKITVQFTGAYEGTATLLFTIESGKLSISCSDLTYNGKAQSPNPVVKLGNATLVKGTDYTVSGSATAPGIYSGSIKGKGNFSNISGSFVYYVNPSKPSNVKSSSAYNAITVSWNKQGNNCVYEIWVYDSGAKAWKKVAQTTGNSYKITTVYASGKSTAIKANTQYSIKIRAYVKGTVNGKSVIKYGDFSYVVDRTNPTTLSNIKATTAYNAVTVSWSKQSGCTAYEIWAYDTGAKAWKKIAQTTGTSYKLTYVYVNGKKTNIKACTQYKIRLRGVFSGKVNNVAVTKYGVTKDVTVFTNPKTLSCKVTKNGNTALKVTWSKDTTVTGYQIQCSTTSNFKSGVKTATINKNSTTAYNFTGLKRGTTYYVRIRSFRKVGNATYYSAYSSVVKYKL